jgi:NADP-dependent 3-hydroxy acid dehydrogenase YdfG
MQNLVHGIKGKVVVITGASGGIGEAFECGLWN